MAFSFGAATPTPAFGASSPAPAFGAASTPAFGAGLSFGAPAAAPAPSAFSFSSTPAASAPSLFGSTPAPAVSTPAFGATTSLFGAAPASSPSLFGAAPASSPSLFGAAPASSPSLFGAAPASSPSLFGAAPSSSPSLFGSSLTQPAGSPFGAALGSLQPQQQAGLITYSTRYDDLPADRQKELQDIQREIGNYREDCEKLDRDQRLHDSVSMKKSLEEETNALRQSLQGMLNSIRADDEALADFREKVLKLLRSTEHAVRTYQRAKLWRDAPQQYKGQIMPPQVQELLASPVLLPSPYLEQAIQGFQQTLENYNQVLSELEQALPPSDAVSSMTGGGQVDEASVAQSLPLVISHMHDYFVHVAARLEKLHQEVQRGKEVYMVQRRAAGEFSDPFVESRRVNAMASTPQRAGGKDGRVVVSTPPQHYGMVQGTPGQGAEGSAPTMMVPDPPPISMPGLSLPGTSPFQATPTVSAASPLPFGTPFGGAAVSPAVGDMNRGASRRRR